ncbi:hypothetical protein ACFXJ5_26080 [Streptomyces sp. NPDC059373]
MTNSPADGQAGQHGGPLPDFGLVDPAALSETVGHPVLLGVLEELVRQPRVRHDTVAYYDDSPKFTVARYDDTPP